MEEQPTYNSTFGLNQTNTASSIITTTACFTNAFDSSYGGRDPNKDFIKDPCLSESLIRNPQSGVIAYLGCSREGFDYHDSGVLGTSTTYEAHFFKNLLDTIIVEKNFAKIVSISKSALSAFQSYDGTYRWTLFGLNPIGDPEMPIFTEEPKTINSLLIIRGVGEITVDAGQEGCRICVMSNSDNGESYYQVVEDAEVASFSNVPLDCSLCITKPGYVPKLYEKIKFTPEKTINKIIDFTYDNGANLATVDIQLEENVTSPQIIVSDIMGNTEKCINISNTDTEVSIDASAIRSGVHIVSLVVDGGLSDSCRFVK